jgi:hypothetical protein
MFSTSRLATMGFPIDQTLLLCLCESGAPSSGTPYVCYIVHSTSEIGLEKRPDSYCHAKHWPQSPRELHAYKRLVKKRLQTSLVRPARAIYPPETDHSEPLKFRRPWSFFKLKFHNSPAQTDLASSESTWLLYGNRQALALTVPGPSPGISSNFSEKVGRVWCRSRTL